MERVRDVRGLGRTWREDLTRSHLARLFECLACNLLSISALLSGPPHVLDARSSPARPFVTRWTGAEEVRAMVSTGCSITAELRCSEAPSRTQQLVLVECLWCRRRSRT